MVGRRGVSGVRRVRHCRYRREGIRAGEGLHEGRGGRELAAVREELLLAGVMVRLRLVMLVVVTTISLLVQFYSQGYMENSAGYARFFSYLSLFTFSMLVIVFAANFLVIFIGWELVILSM